MIKEQYLEWHKSAPKTANNLFDFFEWWEVQAPPVVGVVQFPLNDQINKILGDVPSGTPIVQPVTVFIKQTHDFLTDHWKIEGVYSTPQLVGKGESCIEWKVKL